MRHSLIPEVKMDRKGILFIPLSNNADSMMNILNIVFCDEYCKNVTLPLVDKITFLATTDFDSDISYQGNKMTGNEFCNFIRNELGENCVEIRQRIVHSYAKDIPKVIMDGVKEVGKEHIIIDLTCGKKDITGSLYTSASIAQISNMIYVEVPRIKGVFPILNRNQYEEMKGKFTLTRYESLEEIEKLASLNGMDFIFYKKNIQEMRQSSSSAKMESFCTQLEHIVQEYFSGNVENYRNAIRTMGLISEDVVIALGSELYERYKDLSLKKYNPKRSLDTIRELEAIYQDKSTSAEIRNQLNPFFSVIPSVFEIIEMIRIYRNRASHYYSHNYKREEVKLLLDMMIFLFNGLIESGFAATMWREGHDE